MHKLKIEVGRGDSTEDPMGQKKDLHSQPKISRKTFKDFQLNVDKTIIEKGLWLFGEEKIAVFLNLGTIDILRWVILCCGGLSCTL